MQIKKFITFKISILTIALFITCSLPLPAKEKPVQPKKIISKDNSKKEIVFDSCEKESADKCEKETNIPVPDYSKSLK